MAKEYNVGDRLYLPVWVTEKETNVMMGPDKSTTITDAKFSYAYWHGKTGEGKVRYGEEGLLLTAEEIYASRKMADEIDHIEDMLDYGRKKYDEIEELKARNAELEALLKEVMATRDEAIRQNDELLKENKKLKADCNEWKDTANERLNAVQTLSAERNKVMAGVDELKNTIVDRTKDVQHLTEENANLKAWYEEANKTASEAAEANDDLKAKIAELRDEVATLKAERCSLNGQVGKNLAEIQALSSDVHFFKEACKKQKAECDELKGRYDELDSVNKEQAEKIRDLDKTVAKLKDENTNLSFLLEDQPEKEVTKTLHVVLNDGTEIEFRMYTAYDYRTDINMFVVKDGDKYIAGFLRGDKPMNLAYWWTE